MSALVEICDVVVRRDERQVLGVRSLSVQKGEVLAIVGPNGAGKSSLLLTLARLLQPETGDLLWNGVSYRQQNALAYRRRIALVLQEALLLDTSVFENIAIGLRYRGVALGQMRENVNKWVARLDLEALHGRNGAHLSGGEAQRVSLARAFALNPELLLLDEPFSALDAPTRLRLLDDLKSILVETGTTAVLITHDLKEAAHLASRVAVMLNGEIVQVGTPQDVFTNPASPAVAAFLGI